jgi:hypothetical protein
MGKITIQSIADNLSFIFRLHIINKAPKIKCNDYINYIFTAIIYFNGLYLP